LSNCWDCALNSLNNSSFFDTSPDDDDEEEVAEDNEVENRVIGKSTSRADANALGVEFGVEFGVEQSAAAAAAAVGAVGVRKFRLRPGVAGVAGVSFLVCWRFGVVLRDFFRGDVISILSVVGSPFSSSLVRSSPSPSATLSASAKVGSVELVELVELVEGRVMVLLLEVFKPSARRALVHSIE
jgi:hypothetical protein